MDKVELGQVVLWVLLLSIVIMILPTGFVLKGVALIHNGFPVSVYSQICLEVDTVALPVLPFFPVTVSPPVLHRFIHCRRSTTLTISGVPRNFVRFGGGSKDSVEERGQRERGSGGGSPLVRGSAKFCKWVNPAFLLGCYGCIFHGIGNSAQLW
jgi:hypothetical protein